MFDLHKILATGLVKHIDYLESVGSTSDRALLVAAADELPLPLLVLTDSQTGGRGRGTNRWWAGSGALTFSLVIDAPSPRVFRERWPQWSLVAGLAVCEALAQAAPRGNWQLKWPNDVFLGGKKICGILCESAPGWPGRLVIGVGININNSLAAAPADIQTTACALIDHDGQQRELTSVLLAVLDELDRRLRQHADQGFAEMAADYRRKCLLTGATVSLRAGPETVLGRCQGISDEGALLLQTLQGVRRMTDGTILSWQH